MATKNAKLNGTQPTYDPEGAYNFGVSLFNNQLRENFGASKLQHMIHEAARENGRLSGLYREIWEGYVARSIQHKKSINSKPQLSHEVVSK